MGTHFDGSGQRSHRAVSEEGERTGTDAIQPSPGKCSRTHGGGRVLGYPGKISLTSRLAMVIHRHATSPADPEERAREALQLAARVSSGQALPAGLRTELEASTRTDLSGVRVHASTEAASAAEAVHANAYTTGQDIYFAEGKYNPSTPEGRRLIAHEVAHTVQQRREVAASAEPVTDEFGGILSGFRVSQPGESLEVEAERFADSFHRDQSQSLSRGAGAGAAVYRREDPQSSVAEGQQEDEDSASGSDEPARDAEEHRQQTDISEAQDREASQSKEQALSEVAEEQGAESGAPIDEEIAALESEPGADATDVAGQVATETEAAASTEMPLNEQTASTHERPRELQPPDNQELGANTARATTAASTQVQFADTDVSALLPAGSGEDPQQRALMEQALREELARDQAYAQGAISGFAQTQAAEIAGLETLSQDLTARVMDATAQARTAIEAAIAAQAEALAAHMAQARAQAEAEAETLRAQIQADYQATVAALEASTEAGRAQLQTGFTAASAQIEAAQTQQLADVARLYSDAENACRAAGVTAGDSAVSAANQRAAQYRANKINREDSVLDGHYTDNRCEAQAEAAEKVGAAYRDELVKEGENLASRLLESQPTDEAGVRAVAEQARTELQRTYDGSLQSLESAHTASLDNAGQARDAMLEGVDSTLSSTLEGLQQHEDAQLAAIHSLGDERLASLTTQAEQIISSLQEAITQASSGLGQGLDALVSGLQGAEVPVPEELDAALAQAGQQLATQLAQTRVQLESAAEQAIQTIAQAGAQIVTALEQIGTSARDAADQSCDSFRQGLSQLAESATMSFSDLQTGHGEAVAGNVDGCTEGLQAVVDGLASSYAELSSNLQAGFAQNVQAVQDGLNNVVTQDMPGVIGEEARNARDQVQPRWKSVLKWVIIIAVVLVVAIVLGPMVIGAVTGLAAGLGASAAAAGVIGTVVGGALVGAGASAATTVIDNAFAGRDLTTGLGTAILLGAVGGALGGLASMPLKALSGVAHLGASVAVDVVVDTTINIATGNFSWENLGVSLVMSVLVNGVSANARVQRVQTRFTGVGYGGGYRAGVDARTGFTGGAPGHAGPVTVDSTHINQGDTAGGGPYAGKWNMQGGGHNANQIRPRAASDGYGQSTLATDPVTGATVDVFSRPKLDNAGNPILDSSGVPQVKENRKSLFPESMNTPEIDAAAIDAFSQATSNAPNTQHTPPSTYPSGKPKPGSFQATILTPEGHPLQVEGYYSVDASGAVQIETMYPIANRDGIPPTFPEAPGSYPSGSAGHVTPPDYSYGDHEDSEESP